MASYYVRSGASGAGTGANWANAYTTLAAAFSGKAAGDIFYVSEDHAESQASALTLNSPGTGAAPCFVYCVNHSGSVPPVSADLRTTATISTTGNNALSISSLNGYCYGITFICGSGAVAPQLSINNGGNQFGTFENCGFQSGGTNNSTIKVNNNASARLELINPTFQLAGVGSSLDFGNGRVLWKGGSVSGATLPTTLVSAYNSSADITLQGVDLSALGSGKTLFGNQNSTANVRLIDCKLGSSVTIAATPTFIGGVRIDLIRADSGATNYRNERYWYQGTITTETTVVRTGGATDGTTPASMKLVTTANSKWAFPLESQPIVIWNETVGSPITVTFYGIWGGGSVPNNDDIWIAAEYLGDSGTPQGSFIASTKADNLASGSALSSDSSTWGGSTTAFKMSVTFTPQMKGPINLVVKAAKASSTFYIDPKPVIS